MLKPHCRVLQALVLVEQLARTNQVAAALEQTLGQFKAKEDEADGSCFGLSVFLGCKGWPTLLLRALRALKGG